MATPPFPPKRVYVRKRKAIPGLPWLPIVDDSVYVSNAYNNVVYPPILLKKSWMKAVPYKDMWEYAKPSETIGCSYTPDATGLNIHWLPPQRRDPLICPIPTSGMLGYPTKGWMQMIECFQEKYEKLKPEEEKEAVVTLSELCSDDYYKKRKVEVVERKKTEKPKQTLEKLLERMGMEIIEERKTLEKLQAVEPLDPDEQRTILLKIVEEEQTRLVREEDLVRIKYYLTLGMAEHNIEPFPRTYIANARKKIPSHFFFRLEYKALIRKMEEEIIQDWSTSIRQAIFDYVITDPQERQRLDIRTCPARFPAIMIRAPVTWHSSKLIADQSISKNLHITNEIFLRLRDLWQEQYTEMVMIPFAKLTEGAAPMQVEELESRVDKLCSEAKDLLVQEWIPACADVFREYKHCWAYLVPKEPGGSFQLIERLFTGVSALMSMQLRTLVMRSLIHFRDNVTQFKGGNNYTPPYKDLLFINIPLVIVTVKNQIGTANLFLDPSLDSVRDVIRRCFLKIISVNLGLPRVERVLFPEMEDCELVLNPVHEYDEEVQKIIEEGLAAFDTNLPGPYIYCKTYEQYNFILLGEAKQELMEFFEQEFFPSLKEFTLRIRHYEELCNEVNFLRRMIPLNLVCLNCCEINDLIYEMVDGLRSYIVDYFVNENRTHNRNICDTFDKMSSRASELPETTAELVELTNYLIESRDSTMYELRKKIQVTAQYVLFLMTHAVLPGEDIQLNSRVFLWPKDMDSVLDLATTRLSHRRDAVENALRIRRTEFDEKLVVHQRELDAFKKKDPPILTMEEMTESVEAIDDLVRKLKDDKKEADSINEEEQLLEWEITPFMNLGNMLLGVEPYDKLWHTVYDWHINNDLWYYGPFLGLDADEIKDEVENVWRVLYKLAKTFHDVPGSKRVAEMVRAKVEKFRQYIPVLQTICNPGLQERHWQQNMFDTDPWKGSTEVSSPSFPSGNDKEQSNFLGNSNSVDFVPSGMLQSIHKCDADLPTLLVALGLEKYIQLFKSQEIDMSSFQLFNDTNLKEIGVSAYGARHKMLLAIAELKKRRSPVISAAPGAERKRSRGWPNSE